MKKIFGIASTVTLMAVGAALACESVSVRTLNDTPGGVNVALTLNSVPADSLSFMLGSGINHYDALPVGPQSPATMALTANVSMGSLTATCSIPMSFNNLTGLCSGSLDPLFFLTVSHVAGTSGTPGTPGTDPGTCKHDNGNHWGEYRRLGMTVPPHSGKPNATCKKGKKCDSSGQPEVPPTPGTPESISCQFVLIDTF